MSRGPTPATECFCRSNNRSRRHLHTRLTHHRQQLSCAIAATNTHQGARNHPWRVTVQVYAERRRPGEAEPPLWGICRSTCAVGPVCVCACVRACVSYHRNVRSDWVVERALLHVLGNKSALLLHHVQCQSLVLVSQILLRQSSISLCTQQQRLLKVCATF